MYLLAAGFGPQNVSTLQVVGQVVYFVLVFAAVIALTIVVTKWIAGARYRRGSAGNMQVIESIAVGQQVYLQLVRMGDKYVVIGVTRSSVTFVCEVGEDQVSLPDNKAMGDGVVVERFEKYLRSFRESKDESKNASNTKEQ